MSKYTENFPNLYTYDFDTIMCQLKQVCGADPSGLINAQFLSRPTTAKDIAQLFYCTYYIMQGSENLQKQYVELYTFVKDFFENLNLQEEVNKWLESEKGTETLNDLTSNIINKTYSELERRTNVLESRVSEIVKNPPEQNNELQDIRTGFNGTSYDSAGDSVRNSDLILKNLISLHSDYSDMNFIEKEGDRIIPLVSFNGYIDSVGIYQSNNLFTGYVFKVEPSTNYITNYRFKTNQAFFDENLKYLSGVSSSESVEYKMNTPENCKYATFAFLNEIEPSLEVYLNKNEIKAKIPYLYITDYLKIKKNILNDYVYGAYEIYGDGSIKSEPNSMLCKIPFTTDFIFFENLPAYNNPNFPYRYYALYNGNEYVGRIILDSNVTSGCISKMNRSVDTLYFPLYQRYEDGARLDFTNTIFSSNNAIKEDYFNGLNEDKTLNNIQIEIDKIAFIGDSITQTNTINDDGSISNLGSRLNYPSYLQGMLNNKNMVNYGVSGAHYRSYGGQTAGQYIINQINWLVQDKSTFNPDCIIISAGTNDFENETLGDFETTIAKKQSDLSEYIFTDCVRKAFELLKNNFPTANIFVATPIQRGDGKQIRQIVKLLIEFANYYSMPVINAYYECGITAYVEEQTEVYLTDRLHPNNNGIKKIANYYLSQILKYYLM